MAKPKHWYKRGDIVHVRDGAKGIPRLWSAKVRSEPVRLRSGVWVTWIEGEWAPIPLEHLVPVDRS